MGGFGTDILFVTLRSIWKLVVEEGSELAMSERTPQVQECLCEGHTHRRYLGHRGVERPITEGEDLGETRFRLENSMEEACALTCLEGELSSNLLFEHGGRNTSISLWVIHILLGRLFQERLALGWTMEALAKHYQRESMCSLVKLQDLVDLGEPPLGGELLQ